MWVAIEPIDPRRVLQLGMHCGGLSLDDIGSLQVCSAQSDPLLAYWFNSDLIALVGFIPLGILSGTAYLWMQSTPATFQHKTAVARLGRLTLEQIRPRYQRIIGECVVGSRSIEWLKWLGARFAEPQGQSAPFIIGDA